MPEAQALPQQTSGQKIEQILPPEGVFSFYSNNVGIQVNQFDLRIIFGEIMEVTPERARIVQRAAIITSWAQAKAIARFLQDNVDAYEAINGPITLPNVPKQVQLTNPFQPKK